MIGTKIGDLEFIYRKVGHASISYYCKIIVTNYIDISRKMNYDGNRNLDYLYKYYNTVGICIPLYQRAVALMYTVTVTYVASSVTQGSRFESNMGR